MMDAIAPPDTLTFDFRDRFEMPTPTLAEFQTSLVIPSDEEKSTIHLGGL
jgi:hypothetical protein